MPAAASIGRYRRPMRLVAQGWSTSRTSNVVLAVWKRPERASYLRKRRVATLSQGCAWSAAAAGKNDSIGSPG
jgi:hypothetical protein